MDSFQELWWRKTWFGTILTQKCEKCKNWRSKFQLFRSSFQELWSKKTWFRHFCKNFSWVPLTNFSSKNILGVNPLDNSEKSGVCKNANFKIILPRNPLGICEKIGVLDVLKNIFSLFEQIFEKFFELSILGEIFLRRFTFVKLDCLGKLFRSGGGYTFLRHLFYMFT